MVKLCCPPMSIHPPPMFQLSMPQLARDASMGLARCSKSKYGETFAFFDLDVLTATRIVCLTTHRFDVLRHVW